MEQELKEYRGPTYGRPYYDIDEVDAVLAEKDKQIAQLRGDLKDLWDDKHDTDKLLDERNTEIAELKDKCQMHDFFWEGCGFAKRGFKNAIAVSEAFDKLEAENESLLQQNRELCKALQVMYSKDAYDKQKYKRCLAMARWCISMMMFNSKYGTDKKWHHFKKWRKRWLELATKFKEAK